jgi:hypothetical protein
MAKKFKLSAEQIRPLVPSNTGAIASDEIMVEGKPVGYMYRPWPDDEHDSWTFFSGDETEEYTENAGNFGLYSLNTIANYDPEIIPLLNAPPGSAFIRTKDGLVRDPRGAPDETG